MCIYVHIPTPPKPAGLDPPNFFDFFFDKKKIIIFLKIFFGFFFCENAVRGWATSE
jgi:hypothetical protein